MRLARRLKIEHDSRSECGPRSTNEDRRLALTFSSGRWLGLFAVADGLGGHGGGEVAAALAIDHLAAFGKAIATGHDPDPEVAIPAAFAEVARAVAERRRDARRPDLAHMGTTLTVLALIDEQAAFWHLGDSRLYHRQAAATVQQTVDHSVAFRLLEEGTLTAEQFRRSPMRHRLYRYLGDGVDLPDHGRVPLAAGDGFLLLSDGALDLVDAPVWERDHGGGYDPVLCVESWFLESRQRRQTDNATLVAVNVT